jgi:hypothetical protein
VFDVVIVGVKMRLINEMVINNENGLVNVLVDRMFGVIAQTYPIRIITAPRYTMATNNITKLVRDPSLTSRNIRINDTDNNEVV